MAEHPQHHEHEQKREQTSEHEHEGVLPHDDKEHGEGNYEASRHYREGVERSLREKDIERLAEEAKEALETEGDELRAAEEEGRRHIAEEDPNLYPDRKQERGADGR